MKPRDVVGYRIHEERTRLGMSQAQLAGKMTAILGTRWYPQTVGAAEQGQRAFTIEDMLALTIALGVDLNTLTLAPAGISLDVGIHRLTDPGDEPERELEDQLLANVERAVSALRQYVERRKRET